MFPASSKGGGNLFAFPDTCLTPAGPLGQIPIPYPNTGMLNQAKDTSEKVKFVGKEVVSLKSKIPKTMGDEAGTGGGIVSGKNMDQASFKIGSSKVKIEGQPCIYLTAMSAHNGTSANMPAGNQVAPSQTKVLIMA